MKSMLSRRRSSLLVRVTWACAALAAFALAATSASALTFYKWTDEQGQVHYSDSPPKGVHGTVARIDVDPSAHTVPVEPAPPATPPEARAAETSPHEPDLLQERRATRARLEENLAKARERLDHARKALAEGVDVQVDEWQTTVGQPQPPSFAAGRSNCHRVAGGKVVCPGRHPTEQYYQRVESLQDDVKKAEQAVADAEYAYRRGVD